MINENWSAVKLNSENIKFINDFEFRAEDFVELNKAEMKVGDVIVTMAIIMTDPFDSKFGLRRRSHWITTEEKMYEKFTVPYIASTDLSKLTIIHLK